MAENGYRRIRVGSRRSQLALAQTHIAINLLQTRNPHLQFDVVQISTIGDKILDVALSKIGDKSLFTKELETALIADEVDFVVHSLKDVPTCMPPGLSLGCIFSRSAPEDVVLMSKAHRGSLLETLPRGSVIGTSAVRRVAMLKRQFPHLECVSIRGNLNTRLRKLDEPSKSIDGDCITSSVHYDAIVLAKAGIERLGWSHRIDQVMEGGYYAVSQGALACECRQEDDFILAMLADIHDESAALTSIAERSLMRQLDGGCSTPIGVRCQLSSITEGYPSFLQLQAMVLSVDGSQCLERSLGVDLSCYQSSKSECATEIKTDAYSAFGLNESLPSPERSRESTQLVISDPMQEEERRLTKDPKAVFMGVFINPICTMAKLRMARAKSLGIAVAELLLNDGADTILDQIRSQSIISPISKQLSPTSTEEAVHLNCVYRLKSDVLSQRMSSNNQKPNKKKRKAFYRKCALGMKKHAEESDTMNISLPEAGLPRTLIPNMTGYLITCNRRERCALSESLRLLNDTLGRISDPPVPQNTVTESAGVEDDDGDILSQLNREILETRSPLRHAFYPVKSGVSNCLFVYHCTDRSSPASLAHSLFDHILSTGVTESRHVLRLIPVVATCAANPGDVNRCVQEVWNNFVQTDLSSSASDLPPSPIKDDESQEKTADMDLLDKKADLLHYRISKVPPQRMHSDTMSQPKTFLVLFKARNFDRFSRDQAIEAAVSAVHKVDTSWRICPANPSVIVSINVLRTVACISLLENFDRYRKYNIAELHQ